MGYVRALQIYVRFRGGRRDHCARQAAGRVLDFEGVGDIVLTFQFCFRHAPSFLNCAPIIV